MVVVAGDFMKHLLLTTIAAVLLAEYENSKKSTSLAI